MDEALSASVGAYPTRDFQAVIDGIDGVTRIRSLPQPAFFHERLGCLIGDEINGRYFQVAVTHVGTLHAVIEDSVRLAALITNNLGEPR